MLRFYMQDVFLQREHVFYGLCLCSCVSNSSMGVLSVG